MIIIHLSEILKEKGISQRELSRRTGILQPTISKMCNNTLEHFPLASLSKICEVLDCEIIDILELKKEPME